MGAGQKDLTFCQVDLTFEIGEPILSDVKYALQIIKEAIHEKIKMHT